MHTCGALVYICVVFINEWILGSCFAQMLYFLMDHLIMINRKASIAFFVQHTGPYLVLFHLDEPLNVL